MNKEQQDKLWNELSEESKKVVLSEWEEINFLKKNNNLSEHGIGSYKTMETLFGSHNLNPKPKEYWEIEKELFNHKAAQWLSYYIIDWDKSYSTATQIVKSDCTSRKQAEKIVAINKLLNVAAFLNKNEDGTTRKPDFNNENESKWYFCIENNGELRICAKISSNVSFVYFRTKELAEQAIQILGEDVIRLALSTDY